MCVDLGASLGEISGLSIFQGFSRDEVRWIIRGASIKSTYHGEKLFTAGESSDFFGYVLSGSYKLVHQSAEGNETIMYFGVRGEALGIMSVMAYETLFPFDAVSMGTSRFLRIPRATFIEVWLKNDVLLHRFQTYLQKRIFRSYDEKRVMSYSIARRVAYLLLSLSHANAENKRDISISLTRKEIANYIGTTVESVIRQMSAWSRKKIIDKNDHYITILDRKTLQDIADLPSSLFDQSGDKLKFLHKEAESHGGLLSQIWQLTS